MAQSQKTDSALEPPQANTTLFAGVDEAGLGSILGPLVFGFSVWRGQTGADSVWKRASKVLSIDPKQDSTKFIVTDSKVVHSRNPRGRKRLEATALGFLALLREDGRPPVTPEEFWQHTPQSLRISPQTLAEHPWYAALPKQLPLYWEAASLELRAATLARELKAKDFELVDAGAMLSPAAMLNESYEETNNKSQTIWLRFAELLRHVWNNHSAGGVDLLVDRLGGRAKYGAHLAKALPEASVRVINEGAHKSSYLLEERGQSRTSRGDNARRVQIHFEEKGESRSIATALASCIAKYTREFVMAGFNAYFAELQPGLKPTAGYYSDGQRWMKDAQAALNQANLAHGVLLRTR